MTDQRYIFMRTVTFKHLNMKNRRWTSGFVKWHAPVSRRVISLSDVSRMCPRLKRYSTLTQLSEWRDDAASGRARAPACLVVPQTGRCSEAAPSTVSRSRTHRGGPEKVCPSPFLPHGPLSWRLMVLGQNQSPHSPEDFRISKARNSVRLQAKTLASELASELTER